MSVSRAAGATAYDALYAAFDSPLMQQVRREAYGEDIGQHSWVTADELRSDIQRLSLSATSRLLDVGCGPCGPLVFLVRSSGCAGTGVDVSAAALASGSARARAAGVPERVKLLEVELSLPLPFESRSFEAAISLDVVLHLRDRTELFKEIARVLAPGGAFLFTDAGIVSGPISTAEIGGRSANGDLHFVPPGYNESALEAARLRLVEREDRTASALRNATGRLKAVTAHRGELAELLGKEACAQQENYLETVIELSKRRALTRMMYVAEVLAVS